MKMVKKFLSASVIAAMALSVGMIANAEDTAPDANSVAIGAVTFTKHATDTTLIQATVPYTAIDTAAEVTILTSTTETVANNTDIMYINQVENLENGTITFAIEKSRIIAALNLAEGADLNGKTLYVKMGGTDIDTMASTTGTIVLEEDYMAGDVDGNGKLRAKDGTCALQLIAGWSVEEVQAKAGATAKINAKAADVDGNGKLRSKDGTILLQAIAGWDVELKKPAN